MTGLQHWQDPTGGQTSKSKWMENGEVIYSLSQQLPRWKQATRHYLEFPYNGASLDLWAEARTPSPALDDKFPGVCP